jgi:hypothetical protein
MLKAIINLFSKTPANEAEADRALMAFRLLRQEPIQSRLALGAEQRATIERCVRETRAVFKTDATEPAGQSAEDRPRRGHALLRRTAVEVMYCIERDSVLTPQQLEMLRQLCYRRQGVQAFSDPGMLAALELTPEQTASIEGLLRDLPPGGRRTEGESAEARDARKSQRRESTDKLLATLNDAQRAKWAELTGDTIRRRGRGVGRRREGGRPVRRGLNRGPAAARAGRPVEQKDADEYGEG